jgi:hypothetical protein
MNVMRRRAAWLVLPALLLAPLACDDDDDPTGPTEQISFETSFEESAAGFVADATDVEDPMVDWTVQRTDAFASDGETSMAIAVDNVNDQAKVWIEREILDLKPDTEYIVDLSFDFGSSDWGDVNLWTLFVHADGISPTVWEDFDGAYMTDTGNGAMDEAGVLWDQKIVSIPATTAADGRIHVAIGVWGTYEVARTYYVDDVDVTVARVTEAAS